MAKDDDLDLGQEKKSSKRFLFIAGGLIALFLGIGITLYLLLFAPESEKTEKEGMNRSSGIEEKQALYYALEPAFIINFGPHKEARLLQLSITVLAYDETVIKAIERHDPMIRNDLLLLLSEQEPKALQTMQGKEALRARILETMQQAVAQQIGSSGVEAVFFTGFVMQ